MPQEAPSEDEKFLVQDERFKAAKYNGLAFGWVLSLCGAEVS
jgi:hypothetical protein